MPHVTVEYSANLTDALDIQSLVDRIHEAVLASGPFERAAARTRAIECRTFRIADGRPDAAFIHVMMRIGHGRDRATKQAAGEAIFRGLGGGEGQEKEESLRQGFSDNHSSLSDKQPCPLKRPLN